jgi:hypothetical protein
MSNDQAAKAYEIHPFEEKPWLAPKKMPRRKYPRERPPWTRSLRSIWRGMLVRCSQHRSYQGVTIHWRWRGPAGLVAFAKHMGPRPSPKHTLERIDNGRGYEPGNCRWATVLEQQNNKRSNVRVTVGDRTLTLAQWGRETGLNSATIWYRTRKKGWVIEVAVSTPLGVSKEEAHARAGVQLP